jgi:hypothetical protein
MQHTHEHPRRYSDPGRETRDPGHIDPPDKTVIHYWENLDDPGDRHGFKFK